jgi:Holliday junction resolvase RusA-like endonuclease
MMPLDQRFDLFVPGRAVPQGSKSAFISKSTGRPIVVDKDVRLPHWRAKITAAAITRLQEYDASRYPLTGPVGIRVTFIMERPKGHYGSGRNANTVKPGSPKYPATMPDIDKLLRAVLDGLTDARIWLDDGQVVWCQTTKQYPEHWTAGPGVDITLGRMP